MSDTPTIIRPGQAATHEGEAQNGAVRRQIREEDRLENHPLWPEFLAELEAIRRADLERDAAEYAE